MVLSVHVHLSTAHRHPPTVALPASSSGTREPRSGNFDAPPSLPRPPTKTLSHATHKMEGLGDTVLPVPTSRYLGGLNSATTYCRSAARMLGSLVTNPWVQNWAVFHRATVTIHTLPLLLSITVRLGDTHSTARTQERGAVVDFLGVGVWNPDNIRGAILGRESGQVPGSLQTPRHIALVGRLDEIMFDAAVSNKAELATGNRGIISRRGCCLVGGLLLPCANPRTCHPHPASNPDVASSTQASLLPRSRGAASNRHARPRFPRWQGE